MIIQILKGIWTIFIQSVGGLWRTSGRNVKWTIAILLVALATGLVVMRSRDSFTSAPPDWLRPKRMNSAPLPKRTRELFETMLRQGKGHADQKMLPLGGARLFEIEPDLKETVSWTTDTFVNPGFQPLQHFERSFRIGPQRFLGYYTREGRPLEYTIKHSPTRPKDLLMTVHMPAPIIAGGSQMVFRRERIAGRIKVGKDNRFHLSLGRMPPADDAAHIWGICLPERARLVRCVPEQGAGIATNDIAQVIWANVRLGASSPPVSVVFSISR